MIIGLEYKQALFAVLVGGIGGVLFFYYLSKQVNSWFYFIRPYLCKITPPFLRARYRNFCENNQNRKKQRFTKRNRFLAKFKKSYGLWGIVITTPLFLTIPLGAFLASKYYSRRKYIVFYLILSVIGWTGIVSGLVHLFPKVFF